MEPHNAPIGLKVKGSGVADYVVDPSADAECVNHKGQSKPHVLVANDAEECSCKVTKHGKIVLLVAGNRGKPRCAAQVYRERS